MIFIKLEKAIINVGSVTEDIESSRALTGDNLVVEVGQTYAFRNYVGFDPSTTRAYANKLGNITSSVFFPQITTDIWLFATEMGKTGCNRTDSTACLFYSRMPHSENHRHLHPRGRVPL